MPKLSKFGIPAFLAFFLLGLFVKSTDCSSSGFFDFCRLGMSFFLLPVTVLLNQDPLWWEYSKYDWVILAGVVYGTVAYLLISIIEGQLKKLDKN